MYNSSSTLDALFAGLRANRDSIAQLALVDNGSSDSSAALARAALADLGVDGVVIESTNVGFAGGHWAARAAFNDITLPTLCLNPDVQLDEGALRDMILVQQTSQGEAAIVTTPLIGLDGVEDSASRRRLPTLTTGALYSLVGKLLPQRLRYNRVVATPTQTLGGIEVSQVEATTGALMLVSPSFRAASTGIFDRDYFMYGEDLQLCLDAKTAGRSVIMVERRASVHVKGVSSGFPRSWRSNRAFHDALFVYYSKNLSRTPIDRALVRLAVGARLFLSGAAGILARSFRRRS
ncbi:glycosyltransferase [Microbacterium sp. M3]|uniref:Glycosyltransferase n=1 Tax=Microbacterium arthrosphaerae TaxID=792652 RepID=A0ABU4H3F3_9MICO|nr:MULTISPECIES: glycosyltransferase [Microbacterium]MDW4573865.1 glycosyltransferase [Microbacterium arthrosphaerae]MDW7607720.1 glycosyltransferase [Microbacterium sp. M3]